MVSKAPDLRQLLPTPRADIAATGDFHTPALVLSVISAEIAQSSP